MDFKNIYMDTDCRCISDKTVENLIDIFARKLKNDLIIAEDFYSYWELDKRPSDPTNCNDVCALKGISLNKITNKEALLHKYRDTGRLRPQSKQYKFYCEIKFKKDTGLIHHGSSKKPNSHCNLFKCDDFTLDKFIILDICPINYND